VRLEEFAYLLLTGLAALTPKPLFEAQSAERTGVATGRYERSWVTRKSTTRSNGSKPKASATAGRRLEFALTS